MGQNVVSQVDTGTQQASDKHVVGGLVPRSSNNALPSGLVFRRWAVLLLIFIGLGLWIFARLQHETVQQLNSQCRRLNAGSRWNELEPVAARWCSKEPDKADPWLYRAAAAEGLKDWGGMVQYLDKVPREDERSMAALIRKASVEFETLGRPWDGVRTCEEVLRSDPRVLIAHKQTIFFFAMTLQRTEMTKRIRRAIEVRRESPESYVYLVSASWLYNGSLYRHNTRWLESDPESELFEVARALQVYTSQAKSDPEHAAEFEHIPAAEELLKKYPRNIELIAYFLNRSITEGDLERVKRMLKSVPAEVAEADCRFWRAKAWCQDADGQLEEAERSLRRAYAIDPYWWQVHFQLHDVLRRLGRVEESARFFAIYKKSKGISIEIMTLNRSVESLDNKEFCRSMLELAELVGDEEVAAVLRERV